MADDRASPLRAPVVVRERRPDGLDATITVAEDEPVLRGHFPGFPILPGVCLVECAHQAALEALPRGAVLAAVSSARFLAPVFPGDEVVVALTATSLESGWECHAELSARRARGAEEVGAALVRLRYRPGEGDDGRR